jgi:hypothetical protein
MVAVEDCNDDNQSNGVGKGELRVLGAFGNLSECVGSHHGDGGSGSLIGIKFELDFHCHEQQDGPKQATDKSRYEEEQLVVNNTYRLVWATLKTDASSANLDL